MTRTITARFAGICRACGGAIAAGDRIHWERRNSRHVDCAERAVESYACEDCMGTGRISSMFGGGECGCSNGRRYAAAEIAKGENDYATWKFDVAIGGEQYAAAEEYARMMRDPDGF